MRNLVNDQLPAAAGARDVVILTLIRRCFTCLSQVR